MMEYALYLESGPRRRKAMVHVLSEGARGMGQGSKEAQTQDSLHTAPDPTPYTPDPAARRPLRAEELKTYLQRLDWLQADLLQLIRDVQRERLLAGPEGTGCSIYDILEHVAESQGVYLRSALGKVDGLSETHRAFRQGPEDLPTALTRLWQVTCKR